MNIRKGISLILSVALLFSLVACAGRKKEKSPYRIATITTEIYQDGNIINSSLMEYRYDDSGFVSELLTTASDGTDSKTLYERNEYGHTIRETRISGDVTTVTEIELTLDSENRKIKEVNTVDGNVTSIVEYGYDEQGRNNRLDITRKLEGIGDMVSKTSMVYDKNDNIILTTVVWNDDPPIYEETEYDHDGKAVKTVQHNADDEIEYYTEYSYDETGLVQTAVAFDVDGNEQSRSITFRDENDLILSVESYIGTELRSRVTYTYINIEEQQEG